MAKQKKRQSLRRKILTMVMCTTLMSVLGITFVTEFCFRMILRANKDQIMEKLTNDMSEIVSGKAELADSTLGGCADSIEECSAYIHELYCNPERYAKRDVSWSVTGTSDQYVMEKKLRDPEVNEAAIYEEEQLLANAGDLFSAILATNSDTICAIYLATNSGLMLRYDKDAEFGDGVDYLDYSQDAFYLRGTASDQVSFTDLYDDARGRGLIVTCTAPFFNEKNEIAGVVAMDVLVSDLFEKLLTVDMDETQAFIMDGNGGVICSSGDASELIGQDDLNAILFDDDRLYETGDLDYYIAHAYIKRTGWSYCLQLTEHQMNRLLYLMEAVTIIMNVIFVLMDIVIVIAIIITVRRFSKMLTDPLVELGMDAQKISTGDFDHQAIVHDNDEIGDLAKDFNSMAASLKQYIADIQKVTAEKERIGAELNVATQIQADMLPRVFPDRSDFAIYATMDPAKEVGGDFYDFFLIDDDHLALVMADVSGKGVPAALFMVIAKTLIKNHAQLGEYSPAKVLIQANDQLCEGNEAQLFVTVWLAIIEISTGKGLAANAGHEHPVLRHADGQFELVKYRHSPAVATMEGMRFREHEFQLLPGDTLFVYTDGVPEATNANDELYGTDRLVDVLNRNDPADLAAMLRAVRSDIDEFVGEAPQFDDITMLGMTYFGKDKAD
ncbi:MAG: SpoIIE family protein phosphatase [Oscillospiraceae bacterium]|nr:SpoIIE family protein phosphatase [Oscillospiraceae bacterium]